MQSIGVLITCYNRVETTLLCLESLYNQIYQSSYSIDVYLFDDNSNDGTSKKVSIEYPNVIIIHGNGYSYWGGGMYSAWKESVKSCKKYDYILWLNDDTELFYFAIEEMVTVAKERKDNAIVCGSLCDKKYNKIAIYGGRVDFKKSLLLPPNGIIQNCDFCNGNLVLIPDRIIQKVGILNPYFRHYLGDFEYSARVVKSGFECVISPKFCGISSINTNSARYDCFLRNIPLLKRFKILYSPKGINPFREFKFFKMYSISYAFFVFIDLHLLTLFPRSFKYFKKLLLNDL